jgi:hypothetical protein
MKRVAWWADDIHGAFRKVVRQIFHLTHVVELPRQPSLTEVARFSGD